MQLDILNKNTKIKFNQKAVKRIDLYDDTLYITYETRKGTLETLMCPDLADVECFLLNTVECYYEDCLSARLLAILAKDLEALKHHISSLATGYGKMNKLNYARFLICQSIETILRIKYSQDKLYTSNICRTKVNLNQKSVCFIYNKKTNQGTKANHLTLAGKKTNYSDLISFVNTCFPGLNSQNMTLDQASVLHDELYRTHLNIVKDVQSA